MLDAVTLITEDDQVLGAMDKIEAHRGVGVLHRAISVFLFRKNKVGEIELLLQQRSQKKIVGATQWANTVCGNVWPAETYEACAWRRLQVELGITKEEALGISTLQPLNKFRYQTYCNDEFSENELDQIYAACFDGEVTANPDEVAATAWVNWRQLQRELHVFQESFQLAPWFVLMMKNEAVQNSIDHFLSNQFLVESLT